MNLDLFKKTIVVNINHDDYDVYCGRAGKGLPGPFGNPHPTSRPCEPCSQSSRKRVWHTSAESIALFSAYFFDRLALDEEFKTQILRAKGKVLGCFCVAADGSGACHAKVIAEWLDAQS